MGGLPGTGEMRARFQVVGSLVSGALHHPLAAGFTDAMAVRSHNLTVHFAPHPEPEAAARPAVSSWSRGTGHSPARATH